MASILIELVETWSDTVSMVWFGLRYLMSLLTIFQLYGGDQFYWRKQTTCGKSLTNFIT